MSSRLDSPRTAAERNAYQRGYNAGRKRTQADIDRTLERRRDSERRDKFMCAAITGLIAAPIRWRSGDQPYSSVADYVHGAGCIADEMLRNAKRADRNG